jgi:hypothetical protein
MNLVQEAADFVRANTTNAVVAYNRLEGDLLAEHVKELAADSQDIRLIIRGKFVAVSGGKVYFVVGDPDAVRDNAFTTVFSTPNTPVRVVTKLTEWAQEGLEN